MKHIQNDQTEPSTLKYDACLRVEMIKLSRVSPLAVQPTYMPQQNPSSVYHYPTRLRVAKAATSVQLEQSQMNNPEPVSYQHLTNIVNPPSLLKYRKRLTKKSGRKECATS